VLDAGLCWGIMLIESGDSYDEVEWSRPVNAEHPCDAKIVAAGTVIPLGVKVSTP
jgi:hypothetical protein